MYSQWAPGPWDLGMLYRWPIYRSPLG